jgi:hypothetical protein
MWWQQGTMGAMLDAFTRQPYWLDPSDGNLRPPAAYTRYKCHGVSDSAVGAANIARGNAMEAGYGAFGNNCMDHTYAILSAYNTGPDLLNPAKIWHWQPRDWYTSLTNGWTESMLNAETWFNPADGLAMDLQFSSWDNGAPIQQYSWNNTYAQWWIRLPQRDGYYSLHNVLTGKCLDVTRADTSDGATIQQWGCNGGDNQMWSWDYMNRYYAGWPVYQLRAKHSGKCIDIPFGSPLAGTGLQQWTCNGSAGQEWF